MGDLLSSIGIEAPVLISQFVAFSILFVVLYFVAYKPILRMLDERSKKIKESLEQAEAVKEQSIHAEDEIKQQIQAAGQQGQAIIARATQSSEEIQQRAQEQAKQEAEILLARARNEIKTERDEAIDQLRSEFAELTISAAGKVIGKSLNKESHQELIDKVLKESKNLNKG
jgi:F-type H+-transporting ATPase subunit b